MKTVIKENTDGMVNSLHVLLKRKQKILAIIKILLKAFLFTLICV